MMLQDSSRSTPLCFIAKKPPMFTSNNTSQQRLSLPPIRELLKDFHGHHGQQTLPQSSGYFGSRPQQFQPMTYPLLNLYQRPVSPMVMNTAGNLSQRSSPISYVHTTDAAATSQQLQVMDHQLQQRQNSLELDAHMAIQRANDSDTIPKEAKSRRKKRQTLPRHTKLILLSWLSENLDRPYPNSREKYELLLKTGITIQKLDYWFINARRRKIGILRKLKENGQSVVLSL